MQREFDFKGTLDRLLSIDSEDDLHCQLERCAAELGFTCFAMGHHVDLLNPRDDAVRLTNYHPEWIERSLGEGYYVDDPVHRASTKTAAGFLWSSIPELIHLTPRGRQIRAHLEPAAVPAFFGSLLTPDSIISW